MSAWRYRCPRGHASIRDGALESSTYYCGACSESYSHGPYDAAETEFPVSDPSTKVTNGELAKQLEQSQDDTPTPNRVVTTAYVVEYDGGTRPHYHTLSDCPALQSRYGSPRTVVETTVAKAEGQLKDECSQCQSRRIRPLPSGHSFDMERMAERQKSD